MKGPRGKGLQDRALDKAFMIQGPRGKGFLR